MLLFFGREREIEVIAANLVASRLTVLYGPSGVGKTSLLRAGVVHTAPTGARPPASSCTPTGAATRAKTCFGRSRGRHGASGRTSTWTSVGTRSPRQWRVGTPRSAPSSTSSSTNSRSTSSTTRAAAAFEELAEIIRGREHRANFLISIREDALAQLDAFKTQIPNLFGTRFDWTGWIVMPPSGRSSGRSSGTTSLPARQSR